VPGVRNNQLSKQVVQLLQGRPGWTFEASATPGAPPAWCYTDSGGVELAVIVDGGAVRIYLERTDQDVTVADVDQLAEWLAANAAHAIQGDQKDGMLGRLKGGKFFTWN